MRSKNVGLGESVSQRLSLRGGGLTSGLKFGAALPAVKDDNRWFER